MSDFLKRISAYSPKRLALLAAQQKARLDALEARTPIAIVGLGCRFPGGSDTPAAYWSLITHGTEAISEVPADRWDVDSLYDPDPDAPGKISTRWGGWIKGIDQFDPQFFGIAPREAQSLDPQQRLLLETAWAALEDAGIPAKRLFGTRTGIYCGISGNDYHGVLRDAGLTDYDAYTASGIAHSMASGRLSYVLGTTGPSLSIDTACSSSLVAIHLAVQSLRRGESDAALAGGVNLILTPETTIALSRAHMMAPDGRCKTFDARADGFVRGEGCGVLVLKRLSDAEADGDRIVAVIAGSAMNQDGRSNGLTAPNGAAQQAVITAALDDAGLEPGDVGFVETHGTGTALGDPIEVHALCAALCMKVDRSTPLRLGSIKSQIGHLESAAGVAGVIKAALAISHRTLPGQVNLKELNPLIGWNDHTVEPQRSCEAWPDDLPLRAGVSSFGFSGTNVHLILEPAPIAAATNATLAERPLHVLTVSARSADSLSQLVEARRADLASAGALADIAHVSNAGRDHYPHRIAVVAASAAEADALLQAGDRTDKRYAKDTVGQRAPKLAFVFTGQGAQYPGMAAGLYDAHPVFRTEIERCAAFLDGVMPVPLLSVIKGNTDEVDETAVAQPALFAVEWALAALWRSWGVVPDMVLGHSLGEYVAACVAGVFTLEEALTLVAKRGAMMQSLDEPGAMSALQITPDAARDLIAPWRDQLDIASINGPQNVVISGAVAAMDAADAAARANGFTPTRLRVSHAFHSPLMEPMLSAFEAAVANCTLTVPEISLISNLTGQVESGKLTEPGYWREHVRAPVRFADGLGTAAKAGASVFLEIGPHPALLPVAQANLDAAHTTWLSSLRRGHDDLQEMLENLSRLYVGGVNVDWRSFDTPWPRQRPRLSGYPFSRARYWIEPTKKAKVPSTAGNLPGRQIIHSLGETRLFEVELDPSTMPWLREQSVHGHSMLLSTYQMDWAWQVAQLHFGDGTVEIRDFVLRQPLDLVGDAIRLLQLSLTPESESVAHFRVSARQEDGSWVCLCEGLLARGTAIPPQQMLFDDATKPVPVEQFYSNLADLGISVGSAFRNIDTLRAAEGYAIGEIVTCSARSGHHLASPVAVDTALQVIGGALDLPSLKEPYLMFGAARIIWHAPLPDRFLCEARVTQPDDSESLLADVRLVSKGGAPLITFNNITLRRIRTEDLVAEPTLDAVKRIVQKIVWRRDAVPAEPGQLVNAGAPVLATLAENLGLETRYADFMERLDALSSGYIVQALRDLGHPLSVGDRLSSEEVVNTSEVHPRHRRLVDRMLEILAEDGNLNPSGADYCVVTSPELHDMQAKAVELRDAFPACEAETEMTQRCGSELANVLRGHIDPLALLFPEGSLELAKNLYELSPPARAYTAALAEMVGTIAKNWPEGRRLRILEIGAGTGSATARILEQLGGQALDYVFTDISPLFLNRARSRFEQSAGMEFRTLDISVPPTEQGFDLCDFDVILAGNVIHATPDLETSLGHIRDLLAPDGILLLLEATKPQRFGDLTVGLLDGWWSYGDTQRRSYALMPQSDWLELFDEMGFREVCALPSDGAKGALAEQVIFVARRPTLQYAKRRWLIVPGGSMEFALKTALDATGDDASIVADSVALQDALRQRDADGVIHLGALDVRTDDGMSANDVMAGQRALFEGLLGTVHAMAAASGEAPHLCIVTRGAQATQDTDDAEPAQAAVWGFSHTLALEHPEIAVRRIDLDVEGADHADALAGELRRSGGEDQSALRGGTRLVRRLAPGGALLRAAALDFPRDATCLVTGGLGGLGLAVSEWLAGEGAQYIALLGRSIPGEAAREAIDRMKACGAIVCVLQGDVSDTPDVERCLNELRDQLPPVGLAIHAAGELADAVIVNLDWAQIETVMKAKVAGTWNLMQALPTSARFVMFSSGASVAGSAGQANHAAANAFEDALAYRMCAAGRSALTINWGLWAEIGAGARQHSRGFQALRPIAPSVGLRALGAILTNAAQIGPQVAVIDADWRAVADRDSAVPLFSELLPNNMRTPNGTERKTAGATGIGVQADLSKLIASTPRNRRRAVLEGAVRDLALKVLGGSPEDTIDVTEPLQQRGLDSLMAVELRNLLNVASGLSLPTTVTFDYPSVTALADFIGEQFASSTDPTRVTSPAAEPYDMANDTMSEEELAEQLASQLDRMDRDFST
ncbi:type I polyketide synthase [Oceaniovalibus sp. ACAM 378]|uniref:type I polyketide synthase n=1 Tax=Oceaniovalibus sp. ACAM 378 TaxID=2599923 RepID=UPI0011D38D9D|nr:type I polyketide synthase [Oceaniovalibus sp. ACAM 378]TYB85036.1 SDR family NAD(P)-dependent oxidoreductase [Oceaniovalibus sp. ACAM 378]